LVTDLKSFLVALTVGLLVAVANAQPTAEPAVKKSRQDICHDRDSMFYEQTKYFQPFDSMQACLDSGGRQPLVTRVPWWEKLLDGSLNILAVLAGLSACTVALLWSPIRNWRERRRLRRLEADAKRKWENHRR